MCESYIAVHHQHGGQFKRFWGAFKSGHRAARLGIIVKAVGPVTCLVDHIAQKAILPRPTAFSGRICCAFLVCPPRSGGTVIYQALTCALPSVYLSNAHALFPSLAARLLHARGQRGRPSLAFNNYYGYTAGLGDVYEGNEFFEWAHRVPPGLSAEACDGYYRGKFLHLLAMLSPLPSEVVILKNARAFSVVYQLHRAIPEIIFVRVRRERGQVVESVLRAFHELGSFHPVPASLRNAPLLDPLYFAWAQIEAIEASLDEQFSRLPSSSRFEIPYEPFCERPLEFIEPLAYDLLNLPAGSVRDCPPLAQLRPSRRRKVSDAERQRIQELLRAPGSPKGAA